MLASVRRPPLRALLVAGQTVQKPHNGREASTSDTREAVCAEHPLRDLSLRITSDVTMSVRSVGAPLSLICASARKSAGYLADRLVEDRETEVEFLLGGRQGRCNPERAPHSW